MDRGADVKAQDGYHANTLPAKLISNIDIQRQERHQRINEYIFSTLLQSRPTDTVVLANNPQVSDASNGLKSIFKCRICGDKAIPLTRYPMRRHIHNAHYPEFTWRCRQCDFVPARRHQLKEQMKMSLGHSPTEAELNNHKRSQEVPPVCPLCGCQVQDWKDFHKCFISLCHWLDMGLSGRVNVRG